MTRRWFERAVIVAAALASIATSPRRWRQDATLLPAIPDALRTTRVVVHASSPPTVELVNGGAHDYPRFTELGVTGKLSDVAGLIVFPLVACALARVVVRARPDRVLAAAIAATMIGFALVKLWSPATHACAVAMGALQAPLSPRPVTIVRDPTDLLALPFTLVAWWLPRSVDAADSRFATAAALTARFTDRRSARCGCRRRR
jgi:hypothetical protein